MKEIHWRVVCICKKRERAEALAASLASELDRTIAEKVDRYTKFDDGWDFYMTTELGDIPFREASLELLHYSSSIVHTWVHTYFEDEGIFYMFFNRQKHSDFEKQEWNIIRWISAELSG